MKKVNPRHGSMQYWPRKKAKKETARVRSWNAKEPKPAGFAGYKVGMTHITYHDEFSNSITKGQDVACPVTIIECPPLKIFGTRLYKRSKNTLKPSSQILTTKTDKYLSRKIKLSKEQKSKEIKDVKPEDFDDIRLIVHTQPSLTSIGKKRPEVFELVLGGTKEEKLKYAQENFGKEVSVKDIFTEGQQLDSHSVTKGKGTQGPVKRFGITLTNHKAEKGRRRPGSLGGWCGQGHVMYRIAYSGQTGYHLRTEYNNWLLKVGEEPEKINQKGGFLRYGNVKNQYLLIKGSIPGPSKRLITFTNSIRPSKKIPKEAPSIRYTSLESNQGR